MSAYISDDEQLERAKALWKAYGRYLIYGVLLGVVVVLGLNYWHRYKAREGETASVIYGQVLEAVQQKQPKAAVDLAGQLMKGYAGTPYAGDAALVLARQSFDAGDLASARNQLKWAMENATQSSVRLAARFKLARVLLDQGQPDAAAKLLAVKDRTGFESEYDELKGDVLVKQGRPNQARAAYEQALNTLPEGSPYASLLKMKLDNLGPGGAK